MYNPINAHKLSKESRKLYDDCVRVLKGNALKVSVRSEYFDEFLETMPITYRKLYQDEIPVGGKVMVRR